MWQGDLWVWGEDTMFIFGCLEHEATSRDGFSTEGCLAVTKKVTSPAKMVIWAATMVILTTTVGCNLVILGMDYFWNYFWAYRNTHYCWLISHLLYCSFLRPQSSYHHLVLTTYDKIIVFDWFVGIGSRGKISKKTTCLSILIILEVGWILFHWLQTWA